MAEPTSETPQQSDLEILKTLKDLTFERWRKRREYEWKLSFGLWTAIAAFIAIVLGKDNRINGDVAAGVAFGAGLLITVVHGAYVSGIIHGTLNDLDRQKSVEKALWQLLSKPELRDFEHKEDSLGNFQERFKKHHGILQAAITFVLCLCAVAAIYISKPSEEAHSHSVSINVSSGHK